MKSVKVTYRTIEAAVEGGSRMVVKTKSFSSISGSGVTAAAEKALQAGLSTDSTFLKAWGGGRQLIVPKGEVLEVEAEE